MEATQAEQIPPRAAAPEAPRRASKHQIIKHLKRHKRVKSEDKAGLMVRVLPRMPSTAWADDCVAAIERGLAPFKPDTRRPIARRTRAEPDPQLIALEQFDVFPPAAEHTPMQPCCRRKCRGRLYPAIVLVDGWCDGCIEELEDRRRQNWRWFHDHDGEAARNRAVGVEPPAVATEQAGSEEMALTCRDVAEANIEIPQLKLLPETKEALRAEIADYNATRRLVV
jgi:hypothetical protein